MSLDEQRNEDTGPAEFCWATLVARVIHPVDVQIIEALRWIEQPLSAGELSQLLDGEQHRALLDRSVRRLAELGAVELGEAPTLRNVIDIRYRLVKRSGSDRR